MKKIYLLLFIAALCGCKATNVSPSDVIHNVKFSGSNYKADGTTVIDVWTYIDKNADADKRGVIFSSNIGTFVSAKDTVVTVTAGFENGQLVARTKLMMPFVSGELVVKARPSTVNKFGNYQTKDSIKVDRSEPATLKLLPSSLGLKTGFTNEITLTATLKNPLGNSVSTGSKVLFESVPSGGAFRMLRDTTDATSTAVVTYTVGASIGPVIIIRCTYLDQSGNKTAITDSCSITIN